MLILILFIIIWMAYSNFPAGHDYTFHGLKIHLDTTNPALHTNSTAMMQLMDRNTHKDYFYYYFENLDDTKERYTNESVIYEVDDGYVVAHAIQFHNREAWEEEKTEPYLISKENVMNITKGKLIKS